MTTLVFPTLYAYCLLSTVYARVVRLHALYLGHQVHDPSINQPSSGGPCCQPALSDRPFSLPSTIKFRTLWNVHTLLNLIGTDFVSLAFLSLGESPPPLQ